MTLSLIVFLVKGQCYFRINISLLMPFCSPTNSVSEKSNLFLFDICFSVMHKATRGEGHGQKTKLLVNADLQTRESSEYGLLGLTLDRKMQKRETSNFCLSSNSVNRCLRELEVRKDLSSRNSWVDPNYPRQLRLTDPNYTSHIFSKIESSTEVRKVFISSYRSLFVWPRGF